MKEQAHRYVTKKKIVSVFKIRFKTKIKYKLVGQDEANISLNLFILRVQSEKR